MTGPFTYLGGSLDAALNTFVVSTVASVANTLEAPLLAAMTLSVAARGFVILRGARAFSIIDSALDLAWQAGHVGLALSASLYIANVVNFANGAADTLMSFFSRGNSGTSYQVLDQLESQGAGIADHYVALGASAFPTGGYIDLLTGLLMGAVIAILLIILGGYFLVTKVALALVLSFGPIFIAANAFKATQHWFVNWTNKIFNYVLLMALMTATVALVSTIYGTYLNHLNQVSDTTNPVADLIDLAVLSGAVIVMATQMPRLAAALTSGATLSINTLFVVLRAVPASAAPPASLRLDKSGDAAAERGNR